MRGSAGGFIAGVAATIVVAALIGWIVLHTGMIKANADAKPGGFEVWAADTSLQATLKREAPKGANPVPLTDANLLEGVRLYGENCAVCHGTATSGEEHASAIARGEYPAPPQFASDGVEDDPEGVTYWKVKHGIRLTGMPSWGASLDDHKIWTLALFLKHMDKLPPAAEAAWKALPPPKPQPSK
jgi:mono/diheme cytochrome c family protein